MSIKDMLEEKKKPIILAVAVVALVIVLIVVFVPFGGNKSGTSSISPIVTRKAAIQPPDAAKPVETAKVETPAATPGATGAKPEMKDAGATKKPGAKPAEKGLGAMMKPGNGAPEAKPPAAKAPAGKQATAVAAPEKPAAAPKAEPAVTPVKAEAATSAMKELTKRWAVNTGSFSDRKEAEKFAKKLTEAGYENVYVTEFKKDGINWNRVRVGFYGSKAEAIKVEGEISAKFKIDTPWAVRPSRNEVARHTK
ncbi:MAG: SPOR domain-containing protein [Deltaproteobacteria bacterium]|nr:SPOR domain-containing protein [Deltaproteobacteria bacterium]